MCPNVINFSSFFIIMSFFINKNGLCLTEYPVFYWLELNTSWLMVQNLIIKPHFILFFSQFSANNFCLCENITITSCYLMTIKIIIVKNSVSLMIASTLCLHLLVFYAFLCRCRFQGEICWCWWKETEACNLGYR